MPETPRILSDAELDAQRAVDPHAHVARLVKCPGCGSLIRFLRTEKGKRVPVAPWPYTGQWDRPLEGHEDEAFGLLYVLPCSPVQAAKVGWAAGRAKVFRDPPSTVTGWRPHHADCPRASDFRRSRGSTRHQQADA